MSRVRVYWSATVVSALLFAIPGMALMLWVPHFVSEMQRLGYPMYFLSILGALKVTGALIIVVPRLARLKEWAYAGLVFDAGCAALSRAAIGDGVVQFVFPVLICAVVLLSWYLRPESRRLGGAAAFAL